MKVVNIDDINFMTQAGKYLKNQQDTQSFGHLERHDPSENEQKLVNTLTEISAASSTAKTT